MALNLSHGDIAASLKALSDDIEAHPHLLKPLDPAWVQSIRELTRGVDIDLDARLDEEDD
jgi:hypothetical protein